MLRDYNFMASILSVIRWPVHLLRMRPRDWVGMETFQGIEWRRFRGSSLGYIKKNRVEFVIAKTWKQPKCQPTDEWIKIWHMYMMEYYSAIKKKEIMPFAATWMDLENILSEVKSDEKDKYHMISLICGI